METAAVETATAEKATVETATAEKTTIETATAETATVEAAAVETPWVETATVEATTVEAATADAPKVGETDAPPEPGAAERVVAEDAAAMRASLRSSLASDDLPQPAFAEPAHEAVAHAPEACVQEAVEPDAVPQPDSRAAAGLTPEDAQHIAARLRHRLTNYLTGAGREAVEARCRDALHEHSAWLVGQITREVALALETEVMDWVRDAVDEEIARRRTGHSG
ncbi:DUF2486 family protein [Burkholderia paludis]|uniref:DUF2486 family protein n=1 Tax=Burkholderia TaxID=32008 RepID=UPI0038995DCF